MMKRGTAVTTLVICAGALVLSACSGVEADELGGAAIRPAAGIKAGSARVAPGSDKAFNPQPEPPGEPASNRVGDAVVEKGFNPQPEPPAKGSGVSDPVVEKGFNPQPEPPARLKDGVSDPVVEKGFNPQPEPPAKGSGVINPADAKAFNPQPEPPGQPTINPVDGAAR
ncbi:MAG: hypothetical protein KC486_11490 [Myxococcales bacterium]|nr:hypothetical protein [Myxococcales bacterium]